MRCPSLSELPPPPPGKACTEPGRSAGWPWTEESPQLPDTMPDGRPWPRLTVITLSYNQGHYIEETLRSVLLQGYPNLQFIAVDGGSTNETVPLIRRYEQWLASWTSERDSGQSEAINKGLRGATGQWVMWLNSDDLLLPGALTAIGVAQIEQIENHLQQKRWMAHGRMGKTTSFLSDSTAGVCGVLEPGAGCHSSHH